MQLADEEEDATRIALANDVGLTWLSNQFGVHRATARVKTRLPTSEGHSQLTLNLDEEGFVW